jgi:tRNA threonylcarbamoyl adenosine modification protein YeaZ
MKYLFIDGSENAARMQAGDTGMTFVSATVDTNRNLGAKITELSDNILKEARIDKNELDMLAVCTGPGSLTGLRVAGSFLRTLALIKQIPLVGIDLFTWSAATLKSQGIKNKVRLVIPTLIDKAFALEADLSADLQTFIARPTLAESREPTKNCPNYGIRWQKEGFVEIQPGAEMLHQLLGQKRAGQNSTLEDILKVLPMYVIPSQAERNLKEKKC